MIRLRGPSLVDTDVGGGLARLGKATTTATLSEPGEYVLLVVANDCEA
jgi:hypothetical protein